MQILAEAANRDALLARQAPVPASTRRQPPRGTVDVDINVYVQPEERFDDVLTALANAAQISTPSGHHSGKLHHELDS